MQLRVTALQLMGYICWMFPVAENGHHVGSATINHRSHNMFNTHLMYKRDCAGSYKGQERILTRLTPPKWTMS